MNTRIRRVSSVGTQLEIDMTIQGSVMRLFRLNYKRVFSGHVLKYQKYLKGLDKANRRLMLQQRLSNAINTPIV